MRCLTENLLLTPYSKCYLCYNVDKHDISYRVNEIEEKQRKEIKKIIEYFIPQSTPELLFPEEATHPKKGNPSWGWIDEETNTISIPRRSFYLPIEELIDLIVHEVNHFISGKKPHNSRDWYFNYRRLRKEVFEHFLDFTAFINPNVRFSKGYTLYPSHFEAEYEKLSNKNKKD